LYTSNKSKVHQTPKKLPVCENNHNRQSLVLIGSHVLSWEYPDGIGNNFDSLDNWTSLHISVLYRLSKLDSFRQFIYVFYTALKIDLI